MTASAALLQVAVGMLIRPDHAVLMTSRPTGKPFEGYWEFPGGKIEADESAAQALVRELREEINVEIDTQESAWSVAHSYPHAHVQLHFHWVTQWRGEPHALEGQQTLWVGRDQAWPYPILPATVPLLERIRNYTV